MKPNHPHAAATEAACNNAPHPAMTPMSPQAIDDQIKLHEAYRKAKLNFNKLMLAMPAFVFIFDDDFFFIDILMSEDTTLLHGRHELIGKDGRDLYSPEVSRLFLDNIHECLSDGQLKEIEYSLTKNNIKYYFQARIVPYEDNKVLALIFDIGDKMRRMDELIEAKKAAEAADKRKSAFLANMSHEIRTPLNAIVGFSEMIVYDDDPDSKDEYVNIIKANSDLLLQLINDILDMSRLEAGKTEINYQPVELTHLLREVEQIHLIKMKNGVELRLEIPDTPICTQADPNRVKQVLYNFLSNAIKNTLKGSITIRMEVQNSKTALFSVTDTGKGIEKSRLASIFNRYEKLDDFVQGTGLGLAISKGLVDKMGGQIYVRSEFGVGSTFSFTLPIVSKVPQTVRPGQSAGTAKRCILVAEDAKGFQLIENTLKDRFDFIHTENAEQVFELFVNEGPDLAMINVDLPNQSGIEAIRSIRQISSNIAILAIARLSDYSGQQLALENGCNDFVYKPYTESSLKEAVVAYT